MELTEIVGCAFLALALLIATGQMAFAATPPATTITDVSQYVAEIQRLNEAMAAMGSSPGYGA